MLGLRVHEQGLTIGQKCPTLWPCQHAATTLCGLEQMCLVPDNEFVRDAVKIWRPEGGYVTDREFVKRIRRIARTRKIEVHEDRKRGKGSHTILYFGEHKTTVKKGEIGPGLLSEMIRQLGLRSSDL